MPKYRPPCVCMTNLFRRRAESAPLARRLRIAKLQKLAFGKTSEKIEREVEQLELALEDLSVAVAEGGDDLIDEGQNEPAADATAVPKLRRRPRVSDATPRERRELDPGTCCPDCGGDLRVVGEDVSELLDMIAAQMKVIQIARIKKSCRRCEKMVQEPAPSRPIPGSMAGPHLLAHILVSKFDDHLPLYRQHEIFARVGTVRREIDPPDRFLILLIHESTLVGWCGRAMKTLQPLVERIEAHIMGSDLLHADDTPIRVLDRSLRDKGLGKGVKKGRIWAYVRDQRPWAGSAPPGAVYYFAPDRKEEHVHNHLAKTRSSCRLTVTKVMLSFMPQNRMGPPGFVRPPVGRICDATSMMFGHQPNQRSPVRHWTGLGRSTISSVLSQASLPICALPRVKS